MLDDVHDYIMILVVVDKAAGTKCVYEIGYIL